MKNFTKLLFVFLIFTNASALYSQSLTAEEKEILELQDKRIFGKNNELAKFLSLPDSTLRTMAIIAFANTGDTNFASQIGFLPNLWTNPSEKYLTPKDYCLLAFAIGQIPCKTFKELLSGLRKGSPDNYPADLITASGKIGDEEDLENMLAIYSDKAFNDIDVYRSLVMAIARFALRKIKNENSVDALKQIANMTDSLIQRNIAFAFWRTGDKNLLDTAKQEIYTLSESNDAQTRMWAYNAMGKLQDKMLLMLMLESFNSEKDWRVKVNMLNSLTNYNRDSIPELTLQLYSVLGDAISDSSEHVSLTALNVLGKMFTDVNKSYNQIAKSLAPNIKEEMVYALDSVTELSWRQKAELVNSMSLIYRDEVKDDLLKTYSKTDDYNFKSAIVKAFGNFNDGMVYKVVRDTISADVQRYNAKNPNLTGDMIGSNDLAKLYRGFVEMLSNLDEKVDDENQNIIRLIFTEFAGSKDPLITDISLSALKDSLYLKNRDETASVMLFDYNELEYPKDLDVSLIYIDAMKDLYNDNTIKLLETNLTSENYEIAKSSADALEKINGRKYEFIAEPKYDFDWDYMEGLEHKKFITLKTNKGDIKIELLPDAAPFTVMNFLKLSENNYYDSTIFHRVVSNFVIQGGDPTSTGYGGPGYSIRSEFSPLSYETGMVGMASSGKDTEGSQFFITHSATPHLDGKYTIFGKVTDGMDVVDKIMIGDFIEDIVIN